MICFYIGVFVVVVFEVYLILSKRSREKKAAPINNRGKNLLYTILYSELNRAPTAQEVKKKKHIVNVRSGASEK